MGPGFESQRNHQMGGTGSPHVPDELGVQTTAYFPISYFFDSMDHPLLNTEWVFRPGHKSMVGDGFSVYHLFPGQQLPMQRTDPFLMLDYNPPWEIKPSHQPKGVDVHPHRGFETVTLVYSGEVAHADSAGNQGIVGPGEVQWMHAASGVLHKEYQSEAFTASGGVFHMAQLWVNLPASRKMDPPSYCSIHREQIHMLPTAGGSLELVAGKLGQSADGSWSCLNNHEGVSEAAYPSLATGPAPVCSPIWLFHWNQGDSQNQRLELCVPGGATVLALVVEGALVGELEGVGNGHLVVFKRSLNDESSRIRVEALAGTKVLWMIGQPLNEPIAAYGPFVMNSKDQIQQAFEDYQNGRFGVLS
ncbi:MAG: pirin family protein [Bacteroidia bacterium]